MIERDHIGKLGQTGLLLDPERPYLECVDEKNQVPALMVERRI